MPVQIYLCMRHGEFEINVPFSQDVPQDALCPIKNNRRACCDIDQHVLKIPGGIIVRGGTGAGQGHLPARTQAKSDSIRSLNPTDKAKVQRENVFHESGVTISDTALKKVAQEMTNV